MSSIGKRNLLLLHIVVVLTVFVGCFSHWVKALPCDSRCRSGSCTINGACICNLPHPSTILQGNRPFLGGEFCDKEMTMCDGTNSFWCENGGECQEIVQGENYTCKCPPGYAGENCQHSGLPCGRFFCFHQAPCLPQAQICDCPPHWKGTSDCLLPTKSQPDASMNRTTTGMPQEEKSSTNINRMVVALAISCSVAAIAGGAIYFKKSFRNKENAVTKFRQLSQLQTGDMLDDDDDNNNNNENSSMVANGSRNNRSHL